MNFDRKTIKYQQLVRKSGPVNLIYRILFIYDHGSEKHLNHVENPLVKFYNSYPSFSVI